MTTDDAALVAALADTAASVDAADVGPQETPNTYRWATVTVSSPLQIQLDGDSLPLPLVPESLLAGDPAVSSRVWVQLFGLRVIVLGTSGNSSGDSPVGAVLSFAGATAPVGWLLCNGAAVSRTVYAQLFAVISTTFGVGNGTTTFNVPDLRDRVALTKGTVNATLAATGGATTASTTLTVGNLPAHDHSSAGDHGHAAVSDHNHGSVGNHSHTTQTYTIDDRSKTANLFNTLLPTPSGSTTTSSDGGHTHSNDGGHTHANAGTHTHSSVGSGTAISTSTLQPFVVLNSIIRAS